MKKNKEKIVVGLITVIILMGIILAFIFSNSQKTPPKVWVKNEEGKRVETVMFGYRWKVLGSEAVADGLNPYTYEYPSAHTILSKTLGTITFDTSDKFSVMSIKYREADAVEEIEASYHVNDAINTVMVDLPKLEGNYIFCAHLAYAKGEATYAVKVVITDDNVYEVNELIPMRDTKVSDATGIKKIINLLPFADKVENVLIDTISKDLTVGYDLPDVEKEELRNNTVALFVLVPELESVTYEMNSGKVENQIYFSREELNRYYQRDISEFANNNESWMKEVIYKEHESLAKDTLIIYEAIIEEILKGVSYEDEKENVCVMIEEDSLDNYERRELLVWLSEKVSNAVISAQDLTTPEGIMIKIQKASSENQFETTVTTSQGKKVSKNYTVTINAKQVQVKETLEEQDVLDVSKEEEIE